MDVQAGVVYDSSRPEAFGDGEGRLPGRALKTSCSVYVGGTPPAGANGTGAPPARSRKELSGALTRAGG